MSLNLQHTLKSLAMTPEFEKRLAAVNGVVIASKILQGGQLHKKKPLTVMKTTGISCSICNSACRDLRELLNHFVVCVRRNGNPNGARWDDCLTADNATDRWSNPRHSSRRDPATIANERIAELEERDRKAKERLAAVNGVLIPSKVPAGQPPSQGTYMRNDRQQLPCIICHRRFVEKDQVRVHFAPCVERNGNPTGARWDDALTGTASPAVHISTQSRGSQDILLEDLRPEDYEFDDVENDVSGMDNLLSNSLLADNFFSVSFENPNSHLASAPPNSLRPFHPGLQQLDSVLANIPPKSVQPYNPYLETPNHQPTTSASYGLQQYNSHPRMEFLTNQTLLSMVQDWQDLIYSAQERYALEHPQFQETMNELIRRGLMSTNWKWTVNIQDVNMAWTRAMVQGMRN